MKFPTRRSPFGQLPPLDEEHARRFSALADVLVDQAIDEYEQFVRIDNRRLPRNLWKPVKKLESLTLYRQRRTATSSHNETGRQSESLVTTSVSSPYEIDLDADMDAQNATWSLPKVVTVGTLLGSLEDVMLGVSSPDAASMMRKAAYTKEELVDAEILHSIETPTEDAPFAFVGIKWRVLEFHAMSRRRDLVYLETTGIRSLPDGRQIGFVLTHSVDDLLEGCGSLESVHGILRGRISSCYLFTPVDNKNQSVEVYMKGFIQPSGKMVDAIAISTSATAALQFFAGAVECAQNRKLAHKVTTSAQETNLFALSAPPSSPRKRSTTSAWIHKHIRDHKVKCGVCSGSHSGGKSLSALRLFRSTSDHNASAGGAFCKLCARSACGHCRMTRKLWFTFPGSSSASRPKQLRQSSVIVCTACIAVSNQQDAFEVARADVVAMNQSSAAGLGRHRSSSESTPSPVSALASSWLTKSHSSSASSSRGLSEWHHQYASMRLSTPVVDLGFPTKEEIANVDVEAASKKIESAEQLDTIVPVKVRDVETVLEPETASILMVDEPMKKTLAVSASDRRTRGQSQPASECESTDRESFLDDDDLCDAIAMAHLTASSSSSPSSEGQSSRGSGPSDHSQRDLWTRMEELRKNAEDVYQMTLRTTVTMAVSVPPSSGMSAMSVDELD